MIVDPSPTALSKPIVPPGNSAKRFLICNPNPVPRFTSVSRVISILMEAPSGRWKGGTHPECLAASSFEPQSRVYRDCPRRAGPLGPSISAAAFRRRPASGTLPRQVLRSKMALALACLIVIHDTGRFGRRQQKGPGYLTLAFSLHPEGV